MIFFSLALPLFHWNFQITWTIAFLMPTRANKDENWKIRNEDKTDLTNTTLLARFSHTAPHVSNWYFIFYRMIFHASLGIDFRLIGIPKYLKYFQSTKKENWRIWVIPIKILTFIFQAYIWLLVLLNNPPETKVYWSKTILKWLAIVFEAPPVNRVSSTNWELFIILTSWAILR